MERLAGLVAPSQAGEQPRQARRRAELHYRGIVEWCFRAPDVPELLREARSPLRTSPFVGLRSMRGAVWLEPRLRAEVSYAEVAGGRLRAPPWRGLVTL